MDRNEFVSYVRAHQDEFIHYCEILISPTGDVVLARPSHQEAIIRIAQEILNVDRDTLYDIVSLEFSPLSYFMDRFGYIMVWYDLARTPFKITDQQKETLKLLIKEEILSREIQFGFTHEYQLSEWRKTINEITQGG